MVYKHRLRQDPDRPTNTEQEDGDQITTSRSLNVLASKTKSTTKTFHKVTPNSDGWRVDDGTLNDQRPKYLRVLASVGLPERYPRKGTRHASHEPLLEEQQSMMADCRRSTRNTQHPTRFRLSPIQISPCRVIGHGEN